VLRKKPIIKIKGDGFKCLHHSSLLYDDLQSNTGDDVLGGRLLNEDIGATPSRLHHLTTILSRQSSILAQQVISNYNAAIDRGRLGSKPTRAEASHLSCTRLACERKSSRRPRQPKRTINTSTCESCRRNSSNMSSI
jgi:hypothetical protein